MNDIDYKNINFFHSVKIEDGKVNKTENGSVIKYPHVYTPGLVKVENLRNLYLFDSISFENKSVLDVGCWDGYFSFESELKGASEVVSLDNPKFRWGGMDGYNFLHQFYKSKAKFVLGNVYNLRESLGEKRFDIILCYGVLYHLSDPLLALVNLFEYSKEYLILEGIFFESNERKLELIECGFANDASNIYKMSSGYINYVSQLYGFKVEKIEYHQGFRGSVLLKKVKNFSTNYIIHV